LALKGQFTPKDIFGQMKGCGFCPAAAGLSSSFKTQDGADAKQAAPFFTGADL
jgi:hypothetical protein